MAGLAAFWCDGAEKTSKGVKTSWSPVLFQEELCGTGWSHGHTSLTLGVKKWGEMLPQVLAIPLEESMWILKGWFGLLVVTRWCWEEQDRSISSERVCPCSVNWLMPSLSSESVYVQAMFFSFLSFLSFYLGSVVVAFVHYIRWVQMYNRNSLSVSHHPQEMPHPAVHLGWMGWQASEQSSQSSPSARKLFFLCCGSHDNDEYWRLCPPAFVVPHLWVSLYWEAGGNCDGAHSGIWDIGQNIEELRYFPECWTKCCDKWQGTN